MARGVPTFNSGSIPAGGGSQQAFIDQIVTELTAYQSNGEQAWELADLIDSGADYEAVFHSVGDRSLGSGSNKGDTDIWVYLHRRSVDDYECLAAQDYSPTTGSWSSGAYQEADASDFEVNLSDTVGINWWCVVNEYEFVFVWVRGGTYKFLHFGQPIRPFSEALNGIARITSQSGTGNGVTIGLDRDITSKIKVGQYVWLVNQTPDSTGIQSVSNDLVEVKAIASGQMTVDGVAGTYAVGSLAGIDPVPTFAHGSATGNSYLVSELDGSWSAGNAQPAATVNPGATAITEGDFDPGPDQLFLSFQPFLKMATAPSGIRGKFQHIRICTVGPQADQDLSEIDFDSGQRWKIFISSGARMFTSWGTAIGPGAS